MAALLESEPIIQKTTTKLCKVLTHLNEIWEVIGYSKERQLNHCEQAYRHIEELLDDMVLEAERRKLLLLEKIEQLMKEIGSLSIELGVKVDNLPYVDLPLQSVERMLSKDLDKLKRNKQQRMTLFEDLLAKEKSICKSLGVQPTDREQRLPSEEELKSLALYLEQEEAKKNRLESEFKNMRENIIKMMDDLDVAPSSDFNCLVHAHPEKFVLSASNMTKLKELHDLLKVRSDKTDKHMKKLKEELAILWKQLDEPEHICKSFLNDIVGNKTAAVDTLETEIKRCKDRRKQNISRYVAHARIELERLWDLCKFSKGQRQQFVHFRSDTYTEDLLTLHELEVQKLQKFYDNGKPIFEKLEEHKNLLSRMSELTKNADNPNRFQNRGGQLLAEEKERKVIQKTLPKVEEHLRNLIREYETAHGEAFTINGITGDEWLKELWDKYREERKKPKKEIKDKSVKKGALSSSKKTFNVSKKTQSAINARLNSPRKKVICNPSTSGLAKQGNLGIASESKTHKVSRRLLYLKKKAVEEDLQKENQNTNALRSPAVKNATYDQFKEHLKDTRLCSSLLPEEVLTDPTASEVNNPDATHTVILPEIVHLP